ncbi:MAG: phosphotransferase [Phycisphaeraceae bacterium]
MSRDASSGVTGRGALPSPGELDGADAPPTAPDTISSLASATLAAGAASDSAAGSVADSVAGQRATFEAFELAIVLSHYDLGAIYGIKAYPRGSRRAPKLLLKAETGRFLFKRRSLGRAGSDRVAFSHELQLYLAREGFCLPALIGTRRGNNSMLQYEGNIYEMFRYVQGTGYDGSLPATFEAGRTLARFHELTRGFTARYEPPRGSYHRARAVAKAFERLPSRLQAGDAEQVEVLRQVYEHAAGQVDDQGLGQWPRQAVHCDWHPGNTIFRAQTLVGVVDFDAARIDHRMIDIANAALQFSIVGGGEDPTQWPREIDTRRFEQFITGYGQLTAQPLSRAELATAPWLMIEALIAESVIPVAATGSFARYEAGPFLAMVQAKAHWLEQHGAELVAAVA